MKLYPRIKGLADQPKGQYIVTVEGVGSMYCDHVGLGEGFLDFRIWSEDDEDYTIVICIPDGTVWKMIAASALDLVSENDLYDEAVDQSSRLDILRRRIDGDKPQEPEWH